MPSALDSMFVVPGYADQATPDSHTVEVSIGAGVGGARADASIKVAAAIVVIALVGLWALGYSFK